MTVTTGPVPSAVPLHEAPPRPRPAAATRVVALVLAGLATIAAILLTTATLTPAHGPSPVEDEIARAVGADPADVTCRPTSGTGPTVVLDCTTPTGHRGVRHHVVHTDGRGTTRIDGHLIVDVTTPGRELAAQLTREAGLPVTATCDAGGRTAVVAVAGTTLPCTAATTSIPDDVVEVTATVTDDDGDITFSTLDRPTAGST